MMLATGARYCVQKDDAGRWRLVTAGEPHIEVSVSRIDTINGQLWVWLRQPGPPPRPGATRRWRGGVTIAVPADVLDGHEAIQVQVAAENSTDVSDTPTNAVTPL